ncbi:hypothetical protein ES703_111823 [subsurface metagenome]
MNSWPYVPHCLFGGNLPTFKQAACQDKVGETAPQPKVIFTGAPRPILLKVANQWPLVDVGIPEDWVRKTISYVRASWFPITRLPKKGGERSTILWLTYCWFLFLLLFLLLLYYLFLLFLLFLFDYLFLNTRGQH